MAIIPANLHVTHWAGSRPGSFRPNASAATIHGDKTVFARVRQNPVKSTPVKKVPIYAVRFLIGFAVGGKAKWKMTDLQRIVKTVRTRQMGHPDSSFVSQSGMYSYREAGKHRDTVVTERGAQLLVVNVPHWGITPEEFKSQMQELGETICRKLKQEILIGEWQVNGLIEESWEVTP